MKLLCKQAVPFYFFKGHSLTVSFEFHFIFQFGFKKVITLAERMKNECEESLLFYLVLSGKRFSFRTPHVMHYLIIIIVAMDRVRPFVKNFLMTTRGMKQELHKHSLIKHTTELYIFLCLNDYDTMLSVSCG